MRLRLLTILPLLFLLICGLPALADPTKLIPESTGIPSHLGTNLPAETYVTEKARRLANPKLLWANESYLKELGRWGAGAEKALLEAFAFGIPGPTDPASAFLPEEKKFHADRYGAMGTGHNWGSGRAAEAGKYQIKGIGKTKLVSALQKDHHNNGTLPMEEAYREAIWSEVNKDAPHGSNRVIALIDRGTFTRAGDGSLQRDILVVREAPVRPAHFMKSLSYNDADGWLKSEEKRVKSSHRYLSQALPKGEAGIKAGFTEYLNRVADQHAYLFANRLYHGADTPSNIDISGKLLDFGTQTAQPGYGKIQNLDFVKPAGDRTGPLGNLVLDFLDSLQKESPNLPLPSQGEATSLFLARYNESLNKEFTKLTGVPETLLPDLKAAQKKLGPLLREIAVVGAQSANPRNPLPEKLQRFDLNEMLIRLAHSSDAAERLAIVKEDMPGLRFSLKRREFSRAYEEWLSDALTATKRKGVTEEKFFEQLRKNALRLNQKMPELYYSNLVQDSYALADAYNKSGDPLPVRNLIQEKIDAWEKRGSGKSKPLAKAAAKSCKTFFGWLR